ncbi:type 4a pilus biogenesis protein PilO [Amphritea balenae]|uniref:Pilus assembly protein PilP n=1 Tax=Amphritea balenae TaxID=452629 RepID=A0A3P1SJK8_9GAMM|nr:type 4a pilus biogenesis protein PilO [Amphritea balenae]RRC97246.1 pilus assembly protein PilP [Amphritea balenae]GGK64439.1 type 4 fimbrial biogenesis protein PilO [Amphritea balenae]
MAMDALKNSFKGFDADDLDLSTAGNWPIGVKVIAYLLVFGIVIGLGVYFYTTDKEKALQREISQETGLKSQITIKTTQVASLAQLRRQMEDVSDRFAELLKQLPTEKEVPGLLEDITEIGRSSGLDIQLISLAAEKKNEIFIELPINIKVNGTYHQMGQFVSGVAAIPRIVTLHDYSIVPAEGQLGMTISAKTYRYDDTK